MNAPETVEDFFLKGKEAFRMHDFQAAVNAFERAAGMDPDSEAVHWLQMTQDILEFHDTERYNP